MRTVEIPVYRYAELPEKVRDAVRERAMATWGYTWGDEAIESLEAGAKALGVKARCTVDFFGGSPSSCWFEGVEDVDAGDFKAALAALEVGACPLTGYGADEDFLGGVREYVGKYGADFAEHIREALEAGFDSWLAACESDAEEQYTDETFAEHAEANGYEYTADGDPFP